LTEESEVEASWARCFGWLFQADPPAVEHAVLCSAWNTGIIPTDWKRGLVVPLWKGKGDHQDCNNYQRVTLLSVPCKVFARIIIERVRHHLLQHQRPEQSGFTPKRSTVDCILARQVLTERR